MATVQTVQKRIATDIFEDVKELAVMTKNSEQSALNLALAVGVSVVQKLTPTDLVKLTSGVADVQIINHASRAPSAASIIAKVNRGGGKPQTFKRRTSTYSADPEFPDLILEKRPDGTTHRGVFVEGKFVPS